MWTMSFKTINALCSTFRVSDVNPIISKLQYYKQCNYYILSKDVIDNSHSHMCFKPVGRLC